MVNADESEPGTCKDRLLIENDPHQLIEGMLIAGLAVGRARGLHLHSRRVSLPDRHHGQGHRRSVREGLARQEYPGHRLRFRSATRTPARAPTSAARNRRCSNRSKASAAFRASGRRFRPSSGALQCPTVLNNVETFCAVPAIIRDGGAAFAALGTPKNGGTRLFCLSGHVNKPGVYELPMGFNRACG